MKQYDNELYNLYTKYTKLASYNNREYTEITVCLFRHISTTTSLSTMEKIYYLLLDCECINNYKLGNNRVTASNAKIWAEKIGCSRPQIFAMQKSLESKGYLNINRSINAYSQNNRNVLSTSLQKEVFNQLAADKTSDKTSCVPTAINNGNEVTDFRFYLDQTKILITLDFTLFCKIASFREITYIAKLLCIDYYSPCYNQAIKMIDKNRYYYSKFTYDSLMERYNIKRSYLSHILAKLCKMGWLSKQRLGKYIMPPVWEADWHLVN